MAHTKVTKTYSQNTGAANTFSYSGSFDVFKGTEVECELDNVQLTFTASTINESASPREYTVDTSAKTIHIGGADLSSGTIVIRPVTDMGDPTPRATYAPGSSVTSEDLNNNQTQLMRKAMEYDEQKLSSLGGTMTGHLTMGEDQTIIFEGATDDAYETTLTVTDPTADRTITLPNITGTVVTTGDTGTVATGMIAADAITGAKIADDALNSEHYTDGSIDAAHLASSSVTTAKINADAVTNAKIADDQIDSEHYVAGSIDLEHMSANSVDSDQYVDGSIDAAHLASSSVTTAKIAAANVTTAKIADDAVTSAKLDTNIDIAGTLDVTGAATFDQDILAKDAAVFQHNVNIQADNKVFTIENAAGTDKFTVATSNGNTVISGNLTVSGSTTLANDSIGSDEIAADAITAAKIADDVVNSEHYAAASIDTEHLADGQVTAVKVASNAVTTAKITDANVTTAKIADDAITIGKVGCEQTTISDSDSHIPTSGAVVDYVAAQIAPIGGLEVIADEDNFPSTQPSSGVVISIADAAGIVVSGSGSSTTARTAGNGSDNVTINNFPSSLYSETLASGNGLMVTSTGSSNVYNYHKLLASESDVKQLSDDINDFQARYRVNSGEPGSNNDAGDLVFDTAASKMKVYDGSSWGEVTSSGDFKYLVMTNAGTTNAATLNGSTVTFDLKETSTSGSAASITSAAQLMVSVNGVVQKPNTGTSASGLDGFVMADSDTITFCAAPASGDDIFIIQTGSAITPTTPADGTVTAAKIGSGAVTTVKIADANVTTAKLASDAVTGAKIADDAVDTEHLADNSVGTAAIAANAVATELIANAAVTGAKIADDTITEVKLDVSNAPTNGQYLQAQSGEGGGLTWATVDTGVTSDGQANTVAGTNAGDSFTGTDATNNTLIGSSAGTAITTGDNNTSVGMNSLQQCTTGSSNTGIGSAALDAVTTGSDNTAVGNLALDAVSTTSETTAVGSYALSNLTSGVQNVGVGYKALFTNVSSANNTAVGYKALEVSTGTSNTAVGTKALDENTSGNNNTAVGDHALDNNTTASNNTAVGYISLETNTLGVYNTAVGSESLEGNTEGNYNISVGAYALHANTTANNNTAVGTSAMYTNTTGHSNTAIGRYSGYANTTAAYNTFVGNNSGYGITTGQYNTAIGDRALSGATNTANENTMVGHWAGYDITTGGYNSCFGTSTGGNITTGTYNSAFGRLGLHDLTTGSHNQALGVGAGHTISTGSYNVMLGDNAGKDQVTTDSNMLYIARGAAAGGNASVWIHGQGGGACYQGNNSSSWSTTSDRRLKKNITDNTIGLTEIDKLRVTDFEYRAEDEIDMSEFPLAEGPHQVVLGKGNEGVHTGVIAQEIEAIIPKCIEVSNKGAKTVNTDPIMWALVNAVKELSAKVKALEAK